MLRFLASAFLMVTALLVLLAGAFGDIRSLPDLYDVLPAAVRNVTSEWAGAPTGTVAPPAAVTPKPPASPRMTPPASAPRMAPATQQSPAPVPQQPPSEALNGSTNDVNSRVAQRSLEPVPASIKPASDIPVTSRRPQKDQAVALSKTEEGQGSGAAIPSAPPQPPRAQQQPQPQRQPATASVAPAQTAAPPQPVSAQTQSGTSEQEGLLAFLGSLMTARQFVAAGRTGEARQLLTQAQRQFASSVRDSSATTARTMAARQMSEAISLLDMGEAGSALQAINMAMDSSTAHEGAVRSSASRSPAQFVGYGYPAQSAYFNRYEQR